MRERHGCGVEALEEDLDVKNKEEVFRNRFQVLSDDGLQGHIIVSGLILQSSSIQLFFEFHLERK
jgi:hypothetical protein